MYNGEFNGVFVNVNASEDQEMITSNQVLEDGFLEETEEEEFLNFCFYNCDYFSAFKISLTCQVRSGSDIALFSGLNSRKSL